MGEKSAHIHATTIQQRTHQRHPLGQFAGCRHAGEAADSRPPEQPMQNCFGLIISGVGHRHMPRTGGTCHLGEPRIPHPSGSPFHPLTANAIPCQDRQSL